MPFDELKLIWEKKQDLRRASLIENFGRTDFLGLDQIGDPIFASENQEKIDSNTILRGLSKAHRVTGDPIFLDAIEALKSYNLDKAFETNAAIAFEEIYGNWSGHLLRMRPLCEYGGFSIRAAAAEIVAEHGMVSPSFETAVDTLRKAYGKWKKQKYDPLIKTMHGAINFDVKVVPIASEAIGSWVPVEGKAMKYTSLVRTFFHEGLVSIQKLVT